MEYEQLSGSEKAAVLVLSLPAPMVRDFLGRLDDDEVERIMAAVARIDEVPPRVQTRVLEEFTEAIGRREEAIVGGRERARQLLELSLEDSRRGGILEKLGQDERRIDWTLRPFEAAFVADTIASEHPQTIALILSQVPFERGAEVIAALPEAIRPDVVLRLADLEAVSTGVIGELELGVKELFGKPPGSTARVGGTEMAAKLLNRVPVGQSDVILDGVGSRDAGVASLIRKRMFTFNDLAQIDKRGMQTLLREIATEDLAVALKAASEDMKEKVFANVSSRAGEAIRDEMDLKGPMKLSDVEKVQEQIVEIARRLQEEGRLQIEFGGSTDVMV